jgi:5,6-dimethylbenzimidazole synthase
MIYKNSDRKILKSIIKNRRDVRGNRFLSKPIKKSILKDILLHSTYAPSVGFSQPWEFKIIKKKRIKRKVYKVFKKENQKATKIFDKRYKKLKLEGIKESPINIAIYLSNIPSPTLGATSQKEMLEYSVVCAIQNLWLIARSYNIGIGWVSILDRAKIDKILKVKDKKLIAYLCMGYVDKFYKKPELEKIKWEKRKRLDSLVSYI